MNDTTNLNSGSDDEVQFIASVKTTTSKTGRFILSEDDVKIIESGDWLTDHIIGAAQLVLRDQFPYIGGMENTTLGPVNNFTIQRGEFAQILHTGSSHWVLASNIGCSSPSEVRLYDSLFRDRIQQAVKQQIASIIYEEGKSFKIVVPKVQRQNNYHDCGVFAIAFLVPLLHRLNPSDLTFDNGEMRKHLIKSLKGAFFHPFPLSQVQEQRTQEQVFFQDVPVICDCRMPWDKSAGKSPSLWCAKCNICKEW